MTGRLTAAVLPLIVLLACHGTPAPRVPGPPRSPSPTASAPRDTSGGTRVGGASLELLRQHISELLDSPPLAATSWGIEIRSLATGDTLFQSNAHKLLTPASTLKTVTLAVAADRLGWDYTYETRLLARGSIAGGILHGDLVVVGSGDPSLDDWDGAASRLFASWATRLRELGVRRITGHVIGDDRAFAGAPLGSGWAWDDLTFSYSAPASGLQFNEGTARVIVTAGAGGSAASITIAPPFAPIAVSGSIRTVEPTATVDSGVSRTTADSGSSPTFHIAAGSPGHTDVLGVTGYIPAGVTTVQNVAVSKPARYFAEALRAALRVNGVAVDGAALAIGEVDPVVNTGPATLVATYRSPPLRALADTMMKLSQNLFAESLLRTVGREVAGAGTLEAGIRAERELLSSWTINSSELLLVDGSGLSRYNLATPDALLAVLTHIYGDERLRGPYVAALPVAGRSGTLSGRMHGTAAEGTVQAKTGSFGNARSVAGFATTAEGEPLAFAILANNYGTAAADVDHVADAVLVALAEFRR